MRKGAFSLAAALLAAGAVISVGCGGSDHGSFQQGAGDASTGGSSGTGTGGRSSGGAAATGGASSGGHTASGGASTGGGGTVGSGGALADGGPDGSVGGSGGTTGSGGDTGTGGTTGSGGDTGTGGTVGSGGMDAGAGAGGTSASGGSTGAGGADASVGGSGGVVVGGGPDASADAGTYTAMIDRGAYLVRHVALCGGCHTASSGAELGGNPAFKGGALPAPNLTNDMATGLGSWSDQQIVDAFRTGVDDGGRHLDKAMPYWLFHNMSDADAFSIVAFLRSLPVVSAMKGDAALGSSNPDATHVDPITGFPDTTLPSTDPNYAAAQTGKYLLSGAARCVTCHSPSSGGLPVQSFFSGSAPTSSTQIFPPNITPDSTGLGPNDAGPGWTASDVATALLLGKDKNGVALCGSMPSGSKGYGGLTDADAFAIGVYVTTIPPVSHPQAAPSLEPACP